MSVTKQWIIEMYFLRAQVAHAQHPFRELPLQRLAGDLPGICIEVNKSAISCRTDDAWITKETMVKIYASPSYFM